MIYEEKTELPMEEIRGMVICGGEGQRGGGVGGTQAPRRERVCGGAGGSQGWAAISLEVPVTHSGAATESWAFGKTALLECLVGNCGP